MNKTTVLFLLFFVSATSHVLAQSTYGDSLTVQLEATANTSSPSIQLTWLLDLDASEYIVYRKLKGATNWGAPLVNLPATAISYTDNSAQLGILYDYKVLMNSSAALPKYGYLSSGIEVVANSNRGIAIVVIENSYLTNPNYQAKIDNYLLSLEKDGWYPKSIFVNASDIVQQVKNQIVAKYNEAPNQTSMLVLLGNVPVPYSGEIYPDGHTNHIGAWPTDAFYADMDGNWTDNTINNSTSANPKNHNIPGDGKLDQSYLPSTVELQVGRIDFSDLPITGKTEEQLMMNYLDKLYAFKSALIQVDERGLIDDEFTGYPEGFSQNGYRNFSGLVGRNNIVKSDYFTTLSYNNSPADTYLWSFGCGGGNYTGASGIGSSNDFANDSLSSVFTMLFGSYFGDWNYTNGLLKTSLTQGNTLTTVWAGRPNWHFYHMAMGENIGYSAKLTQNNNSNYISNTTYNFFNQYISTCLLGDPALRNTYLPTTSALSASGNGTSTNLVWNAEPTADGYNIYRRYEDSTNFEKLNANLVTNLNFTDNSLTVPGQVIYYVKSVKNKISPSGMFENESLAAKVDWVSTVSIPENEWSNLKVYPNPFQNQLTLRSKSSLNYRIVDLRGVIVAHGKTNQEEEVIHLENISEGIYLLHMENEKTGSVSTLTLSHIKG